MRVVIVGSGQVGVTLAEKLSVEGHDVMLIESDPNRVRELADTLDVQVLEGNGATARMLRRAGAEGADLVLATTDSDEANFVVGRLATELFHNPRVVVRLRDPAHEEGLAYLSREEPGTPICINPERAAVDKILGLLAVPGALDVESFMDDELRVAGFRIDADSEFVDRPVSDMRLFFAETPSLVLAIQRRDRALVPNGAEPICAGDLVYFAIARTDLDGFLELVGAPEDQRHQVMIAGATRIGCALARELAASGERVKLIEVDADLARKAADELGQVDVVQGRVTNERLLDDEEIERVSTFIGVTRDHETNLVSGLLAKRLGARRAFAVVDNPALANLIGETAIDAIVSPRLLAIGLILRHVPGAHLTSMAALLGDRVEVMEAEALRGSRITSGKLGAVGLPPGVLVAALRRGGELRLPRGSDAVEPGDRLLLVAATEHAARLPEFLAG